MYDRVPARTASILLLAALAAPCGLRAQGDVPTQGTTSSEDANRLIVNRDSEARSVLTAVPASAALERFEMLDDRGRSLSYVAFTETEVGGLVFVDGKLLGTVSRKDAQAFYSCRGYATATHRHWAAEASAWAAGLLGVTRPAQEVTLKFTGKSTYQSIKDVVENPAVSQVRSLVDMGTNPLNIFRTLNQAHEDSKERERREQIQRGLSTVTPGMAEDSLASIVRPDDVSFVSGGLVMAYPRFSVEFFVAEGKVRVAQQPSFHQLSRDHAALFYVPHTQWTRCTPQNWTNAQQSTAR